MSDADNEERDLQSVALQNSRSILQARRRMEDQLLAAQQALQRSNEQISSILESITDALMVVDEEWRFTYLNPKGEEILRPLSKTRESVTGRVFWDEFPDLLGTFVEQSYRRVMKERVATAIEVFYPPLDSWFDVRVYPFDKGVSIYFQDVSRRKNAELALRQSEEDFRSLADSIPQLAWMAHPDGHIFWYNRGWYEYTGTTFDQMEGWGWQSVHDPKMLPIVVERWRASISTGEPFELEFPLRSAGGEFRSFLTRIKPLRDGDGRVQRWFGTSTDVEQVSRIRQALEDVAVDNARLYEGAQKAADERERLLASERSARAAAERMSEMKDEFLATLSHELRTPLSAILGWSHILRLGVNSEADLRQGLETIERNARVQTRLIEDLLDMSRIAAGKVRLDVQAVAPISFVEAALETVRPAADAKNIRLEKLLDPDAGPISGDPGRLQQVAWNLLSNAIKFTPKGGKVQVVLERVNSHIEFSVADTGVGIEPEFLAHVFERFRQADASTTRKYGGLGLGLSIVKDLVELHGGTVRAQSEGEGRGALFAVHLPLMVVHSRFGAARLHPQTPPVAAAEFKVIDLSGIKVLVVDDEPDARELIKRVLSECAAEVTAVGNAADALEAVRTVQPHVLVSDIGMPEVDGFELLQRIRALGEAGGGKLPAIALTAFARSEDRTRALRAGFLVHVSKPVEPSELIATVATVVGRTGTAAPR